MFFATKRATNKRIAEIQNQKILAGQNALLAAAVDASTAANELTESLKAKLSDSNRKFDATAKILHDALIICTPDGIILFANAIAEKVFGAQLAHKNFKMFLCPHKYSNDLWSILAEPQINGLCSIDWCYNLDIKSERIIWSDQTWSIFIVIRDPSHETINNVRVGCRYRNSVRI